MNVLLLSGGKSIERDVSFRSGKTIEKCLRKLGYKYENFDPSVSDRELLVKARNFDVVFIALHGKPGEDGSIQELFEKNNIKYTFSDAKSSKLCIDKAATKDIFIKNNIKVPNGKLVTKAEMNDDIFSKPYVLKPNDEGSSLDTLIARHITEESLRTRKQLIDKYKSMLAEELIEGTEITVGVFNAKALPIIEIIPPKSGEFDYENKYNGKTQELIKPKNVPESIQTRAKKLAEKIHRITGCRDVSRTDFIINNGELYALETNTIPGLTDQSLLPKMLSAEGVSMPKFVEIVINSALSRQS